MPKTRAPPRMSRPPSSRRRSPDAESPRRCPAMPSSRQGDGKGVSLDQKSSGSLMAPLLVRTRASISPVPALRPSGSIEAVRCRALWLGGVALIVFVSLVALCAVRPRVAWPAELTLRMDDWRRPRGRRCTSPSAAPPPAGYPGDRALPLARPGSGRISPRGRPATSTSQLRGARVRCPRPRPVGRARPRSTARARSPTRARSSTSSPPGPRSTRRGSAPGASRSGGGAVLRSLVEGVPWAAVEAVRDLDRPLQRARAAEPRPSRARSSSS